MWPYWGILVIDMMSHARESIRFPPSPKWPVCRTLVFANATLKCTTIIVHERSRWLPKCFCLFLPRRDDSRGTTIYFDNEILSSNQAFSLRGGGGRVGRRADASVCLHEMLLSLGGRDPYAQSFADRCGPTSGQQISSRWISR